MVRPEAKYERIAAPRRNVDPSPPGLLSLTEAGARLHRAPTTIRLWAIDGRLEAKRRGHRIFVTNESVEAAEKLISETGRAIETERRSERANPVDGGNLPAESPKRSESDSGSPEAIHAPPSPELVPDSLPNTEPNTAANTKPGYRPWRT